MLLTASYSKLQVHEVLNPPRLCRTAGARAIEQKFRQIHVVSHTKPGTLYLKRDQNHSLLIQTHKTLLRIIFLLLNSLPRNSLN